jgi:plastocyanin domain-containing protein
MFDRKAIVSSFASLGFLLGITSGIALAQMPTESLQTSQFRYIEQPLELKAGVTLGGIALIGLELWWFLYKPVSGRD